MATLTRMPCVAFLFKSSSPELLLTSSCDLQALSEMANFIKTLHQKRGDEFTSDLVNRFFPSIGFPQDKMQDFVMQLSNCSEYVFSAVVCEEASCSCPFCL